MTPRRSSRAPSSSSAGSAATSRRLDRLHRLDPMAADPPSRSDGPDPGLDVDAAFAEIVAHWGPTTPEVPEDGGGATPAPEAVPADGASGPSAPAPPADPSDAGWSDPLNSRATW